MFRAEHFREYDPVTQRAPAQARRVRMWDLAATEATPENPQPAFTAGVRGATWGERLLLEDVVRAQLSPGAVEELVVATARRDGRGTEIWMEQEGGSGGKNTIAHYSQMLTRLGFAFYAYRPRGSKEERARPWAAGVYNGLALLPYGAHWRQEYVEEHAGFPLGHWKDQVDASSALWLVLMTGDELEEESMGDEGAWEVLTEMGRWR
jgi:predicted phage terminase large subunit-like protein